MVMKTISEGSTPEDTRNTVYFTLPYILPDELLE